LSREVYDAAVITYLSSRIKPSVKQWFRARRTYEFSNGWIRAGDPGCVAEVARAAGWEAPLPDAFAVSSRRRFRLRPHTVALHSGCKPGWGFKRWHGFAELATHLPRAVVIGTAADLEADGACFPRLKWPPHVRILAGRLSLPDTAALLRQCELLVSNDSGMFHLAAAVGARSLGIFGPTVPQREAMVSPNVFTITKGLDCEPQCRREWPAGRTACDRQIECLRALTPAEVLESLRCIAPEALEP
jgi:ADP-heptose:LPS heptosyltransferase